MTTMPIVLVAVMAVLYACGVYLMLDRSLTRLLLGFLLVGNATNLLIFLMSGSFGAAPMAGSDEAISDPVPQAFVLTSIVITFAVSAFLLALIYRSWRLASGADDQLEDDKTDAEMHDTTSLTTAEVTDDSLADAPETLDDDDLDDPGPFGEPDEPGEPDGQDEAGEVR